MPPPPAKQPLGFPTPDISSNHTIIYESPRDRENKMPITNVHTYTNASSFGIYNKQRKPVRSEEVNQIKKKSLKLVEKRKNLFVTRKNDQIQDKHINI